MRISLVSVMVSAAGEVTALPRRAGDLGRWEETMALEQHAFVQKAKVPSRNEWQAAIDQLGFDLQLFPDLKPFENSGFLPCRINGKDSGFEIYYEPADDLLAAYPDMKEKMGGRDFAISFRWGGEMGECACELIASAAPPTHSVLWSIIRMML